MDIKDIHNYEIEMLSEIDRICKEENITYYLSYGSVLGAVREKGIIPWDTDIDLMVKIEDLNYFLDIIDKKIASKFLVLHREKNRDYDGLVPVIVLADGWHDLIHIDIFPMVGIPNNKISKKLNPIMTSGFYKIFNFKKNHYKKEFEDFVPQFKHIIRKILLFPIPLNIIEKMYHHMSYSHPTNNSEFIYSIGSPYGKSEVIPNDYLGNPVYMEFEGGQYPVPNKWDEYLTHIYGDYMVPKKNDYLDYISK